MDYATERFLEENRQLREETTRDGRMSERTANEYADWLVRTGRMSRFDAAQEANDRSVRKGGR